MDIDILAKLCYFFLTTVLLGHKVLTLDAVVIAHAEVLGLWLDCCCCHDNFPNTGDSWSSVIAGQFAFFVSFVKNSPVVMPLDHLAGGAGTELGGGR